jgi:hypothetical protein
MNEQTGTNDPTQTGVRDLQPDDFDADGVLKNPEMAEHFDATRAALLGQPVSAGKTNQGYEDAPPVVEKADADEKVVISRGDSADFLMRKYSRKQLTDAADELKIPYKGNASNLSIAIDLQKKWATDNPETPDNALNTLPAAPELNKEGIGENKKA